MAATPSLQMLAVMASVAPGQPVREGLDRIRQSGKGALIVIGDDRSILEICSGGFLLDAAFTPQRLSELAKMDGAIILAGDASRIARANVHLVPDPTVPTGETGTRHRTAERVARSLGVPVISVSESRDALTIYLGDEQHPLLPSGTLLARANQAVQTLEKYRSRLTSASAALAALEVEDLVTRGDVASFIQRIEMVRRIAEEIEVVIVELGADGRLVRLQLEELFGNALDDRRLVVADYLGGPSRPLDRAMARLDALATEELVDLRTVAEQLSPLGVGVDLSDPVQPRGYRLLSRVRGLSATTTEDLVSHFGTLQKILRSTPEALAAAGNVGEARAKAIKNSLSRLAETSILDRYV